MTNESRARALYDAYRSKARAKREKIVEQRNVAFQKALKTLDQHIPTFDELSEKVREYWLTQAFLLDMSQESLPDEYIPKA